MPSKLLIAAADAAHHVRTAGTFGIRVPDGVSVDGPAVLERVRRERDRFVGFVLASVEAVPPAQRLRGHARFVGPTTLTGRRPHPRRGQSRRRRHRFEPERTAGAAGRARSPADQRRRVRVARSAALARPSSARASSVSSSVRPCTVSACSTTFFSRSEHLGPLTDPMLRVEAASILGGELDLQLTSEPVVSQSADGFHFAGPTQRDRARGALRRAAVRHRAARQPRRARPGARRRRDRARRRSAHAPVGDLPIFFAGDAGAYRPVLHEAADEGDHRRHQCRTLSGRACQSASHAAGDRVHAARHGDRRDTVQRPG